MPLRFPVDAPLPNPRTLQSDAVEGPPVTAEGPPVAASLDQLERPADVIFTPQEDAYAYEARCLDEVIAARRADPTAYPPEDNPYRVLYMVFNLRNRTLCDKLIEASRAGVKVQVLIEADQIKADRPWNQVDDWFEAQGLTVLRSDRDVEAARLRQAHMIGIDKRSLMHMKARIFRWRDPETGEARSRVLSGSLNPGGAPVVNDENLNLLSGQRLADMYERRFDEIREHKLARNTWDPDQPINVLFTPYYDNEPLRPTDKLFEWIDQEQELIVVSVFALRDLATRGDRERLVQKLARKHAEGVPVLVLTDRRKSDGLDANGVREVMYGRPAPDDPTDEALNAAGVPCLELVNTASPFAAVHGKSVLLGLSHMRVVTGAGNWTIAAMGSDDANPVNEESFLFVDSGRLDDNYFGRAYLSNLLDLLRKYDDQYPQPAAELIAELQRLPGWPRVAVDLSAFAQAHQGRELYLVSDDPTIRARTPEGAPGLPLATGAAAGQPPFRPPDPVALPFGTLLDYRIGTRDPQSGALEVGEGAHLLAVDAPAPHGL